MRTAVLGSSQLYDLIDETLVTSLRLFTLGFSKRIILQKNTSKIRYEETLAFLSFFQNIFRQKLNFFRRVIKIK